MVSIHEKIIEKEDKKYTIHYFKYIDQRHGDEGIKCVVMDDKDRYVVDVYPFASYKSIIVTCDPKNTPKFMDIVDLLNSKVYETDESTIVESIVFELFDRNI